MGTSFFKGAGKPGAIGGGNSSMNNRAMGYATHGAALGAAQGIKTAQGINKAGAFKPMKNSAAYPKGPKI